MLTLPFQEDTWIGTVNMKNFCLMQEIQILLMGLPVNQHIWPHKLADLSTGKIYNSERLLGTERGMLHQAIMKIFEENGLKLGTFDKESSVKDSLMF